MKHVEDKDDLVMYIHTHVEVKSFKEILNSERFGKIYFFLGGMERCKLQYKGRQAYSPNEEINFPETFGIQSFGIQTSFYFHINLAGGH